MIFKKFGDKYTLRFEVGDDFFSEFNRFLDETRIDLAKFEGIGSFNKCELGFFDPTIKEYRKKPFDATHEVVSLTGNISIFEGKPFLHTHVVIADKEFNSKGGHLFAATIGATLEVTLEKISGSIDRKLDSQVGLKLLDL